MFVLGIETSCDETAIAVTRNGSSVLSNVIASQIKLHAKTGGVVPEVAAREHAVKIIPVLKEALRKARVSLDQIGLIGVTQGPGLVSSLLIGTNLASALALVKKIPLVPVNHVEGHIYANWLELKPSEIKFPIVVLTVSGGHNELILMKKHCGYQTLGSTLDDAGGEAFDKVARILNLGYPGGPAIAQSALKGNPKKYRFPRAFLEDNTREFQGKNFNFSFSGLKTAVYYLVQKEKKIKVEDVAASFQEAVVEVLAKKLVAAARKYRVKEIHLAGGVSANQRLRKTVKALVGGKFTLRFPARLHFCTDNAAMIGAAAYFKFQKNPAKFKKWHPVIADPNLWNL